MIIRYARFCSVPSGTPCIPSAVNFSIFFYVFRPRGRSGCASCTLYMLPIETFPQRLQLSPSLSRKRNMSVEVWRDSYELLEMNLCLKKVLVLPPHPPQNGNREPPGKIK